MDNGSSGQPGTSRRARFIDTVRIIVSKDLRSELRSRQVLSAMGLFALLSTMVFYYTLEGRPDVRLAAIPAILWVIVVFSSTLGLSRSLSSEHDRGSLDALLLAPIDRAALFYAKFITNWLFSGVVAVFVTAIAAFVFNINFLPAWWIIVLLGTVGLAAVGTLLGSMAIHARGRETTLPIIVLPVALPILMAAVSASTLILQDRPIEDWSTWLVLLLVSDIVFLAVPLVLFEFIVEE